MPFVPVVGVALAEIRLLLFGQRIELTQYYNFDDPPPTSAMDTLAASLITWFDTELSTPLSSNLSLREVAVTDLSTATSPQVTAVPVTSVAGKDDSPSTPGNVALCVSFRTIFRGRSFRGRNFVPGIPADQIVGNTINDPVAGAIQDAYFQLLSDHSSSLDGQWGVVSRFTGGAPRAAGVFTPITTVVLVDRNVDSQRRRLTGRGE